VGREKVGVSIPSALNEVKKSLRCGLDTLSMDIQSSKRGRGARLSPRFKLSPGGATSEVYEKRLQQDDPPAGISLRAAAEQRKGLRILAGEKNLHQTKMPPAARPVCRWAMAKGSVGATPAAGISQVTKRGGYGADALRVASCAHGACGERHDATLVPSSES
jgi:hypothetical protein